VRFGGLANLTGVPAASVPCGLTATGLPIGLQLLGPWDGEARVLDAAAMLERATSRRHVDASPPLAETAAAQT
jgi:Asp-tRNA(Asn)/Glu-tRNA(Gln) amidotransferase A subunit family amidase